MQGERDPILDRPAEIARGLGIDAPDADSVGAVFQPIVDLYSGATVGYEALTRGPPGSEHESPLALLGAAREGERLGELDRALRDAALRRARNGGVLPPHTVFVNIEVEAIRETLPADGDETWQQAPEDLRCCIEITERSLMRHPAELLDATAQIRDLVWGIALDDVGVDPRSLALMPLLRPDVIKLDAGLVRGEITTDVAQVVNAVAAETEVSGAVVVAEGIETKEHFHRGLALGATHGQGYMLGRPGPLPNPVPPAGMEVAFLGALRTEDAPTPFQLVRPHQPPRRGSRDLMLSISHHLENQALAQGQGAVVLAATGELGPMESVGALADSAALVALLGVGLDGDAPEGVQASQLDRDDPLSREWALTVISPHFAAALTGRLLGTGGPGGDQFEFAVTHDRELVVSCARSLMARVPGA